jgi:hypothetical protein
MGELRAPPPKMAVNGVENTNNLHTQKTTNTLQKKLERLGDCSTADESPDEGHDGGGNCSIVTPTGGNGYTIRTDSNSTTESNANNNSNLLT